MLRRWYAGFGLALWLCLVSGGARGLIFDVSINTGSLAGADAVLAFDLIDGDGVTPSTTVDLGLITTDGTAAGSGSTGGVSGGGPWTLTDSTFFNELLLRYNPLGSTISFSFEISGGTGTPPDGFAFFLLEGITLTDPSQCVALNCSLLSTSDPTGADALFLLSVGDGAPGPEVYPTTSVQGFSLTLEEVPPQGVPEPAPLALLAFGAMAGLHRWRRRTSVS